MPISLTIAPPADRLRAIAMILQVAMAQYHPVVATISFPGGVRLRGVTVFVDPYSNFWLFIRGKQDRTALWLEHDHVVPGAVLTPDVELTVSMAVSSMAVRMPFARVAIAHDGMLHLVHLGRLHGVSAAVFRRLIVGFRRRDVIHLDGKVEPCFDVGAIRSQTILDALSEYSLECARLRRLKRLIIRVAEAIDRNTARRH